MATRTKEHGDLFEIPGIHRAIFPLGLAIGSAVIVGLAPAAAVLNVQWTVDAHADAVRYAWLYTAVALTFVLTLVWPMAALSARPERRSWDLAAIALAAIPAMALAAWMAVTSLMLSGKTLMVLGAVAIWMQGMMTIPARSSRIRACLAGITAVLSLAVPAIAYLQEEFVGGSTAWAALSPTISVATTATGSPGTAAFWAAALYGVVGAALIALSPRANPKPS